MKIRLTAAAQRHLRAGTRFYEDKSGGLGTYFFDSLTADIDSLRIHAGVPAVRFNGYHRMVSRRFPYPIYYRIEHGEIRVRAVLDDRRNPASVKDLLTDPSTQKKP